MADVIPPNSDNQVKVPRKLVDQVVDFIQDHPAVNELFDGKELTEIQVGKAIVDTLDTWNYSPPVLTPISPIQLISVVRYGAIRVAVVKGAAAKCLRMLIIRHAKNDMPVTSGNVTYQAHAIWKNLREIASDLMVEFESDKIKVKTGLNVMGAYTQAPSELDAYYSYGLNDGSFILI